MRRDNFYQWSYVFVVVSLFVCLFVCYQLCSKTSEQICIKFSGKVDNGPQIHLLTAALNTSFACLLGFPTYFLFSSLIFPYLSTPLLTFSFENGLLCFQAAVIGGVIVFLSSDARLFCVVVNFVIHDNNISLGLLCILWFFLVVLILFSQYHSQQVGWKAEKASPKWPILCRVQGCKTLIRSIKFMIYIRLSLQFPRNPKYGFSVWFLLTLFSKYVCIHVFYILQNCPITLMLFTVYRYKIETVKCLFFFTGYILWRLWYSLCILYFILHFLCAPW